MLVYQLPGAFRRLPRPSSPVIAKASITCTLSLDPITVGPWKSDVTTQQSEKPTAAHDLQRPRTHTATSVFAPASPRAFCVGGEARYNSTLRIQSLISLECALPSRIVKEPQPSTLRTGFAHHQR